MIRVTRFSSAVIASVLLVCVSLPVQAEYGITVIPTVEGGSTVYGNGISDDGLTVVGQVRINDSLWVGEALSWTEAGGSVTLGTFPSSFGQDASADGSVIVGGSTYSTESGAPSLASRFVNGGNAQSLGDLPGGLYTSGAYAVSADGSVIVGYGTINDSGMQEAFRWTESGGMVGLGSLPGGMAMSLARGVSADGSVVAGVAASTYPVEAFIWTQENGMVGLGALPTGGGLMGSNGFGISADGTTVVGWSWMYDDEVLSWQAFRWTEAQGMMGLGDIAGGKFWSHAYATSGDGSIVVGDSKTMNDENVAFIWDEDNGMRSLMDVLVNNGVDMTGWSGLGHASSITPDGRYIVGSGTFNGQIRGYVAMIPEPGSLSVLSIAALVMIRRK